MLADGEAPEHGLSHDAEREGHREPGEVAPERTAREREHGDDTAHHADQPRQRPVAELDQRVGGQRRVDLAVAFRPGRAAEARSRQPDRRSGEDDQRKSAERDVGDATELGGRDGETGAHRPVNDAGWARRRRCEGL